MNDLSEDFRFFSRLCVSYSVFTLRGTIFLLLDKKSREILEVGCEKGKLMYAIKCQKGKEIVKVMESDPQIGIVQCKSLSMRDKRTLDSAMNFVDKFGYAYALPPTRRPNGHTTFIAAQK